MAKININASPDEIQQVVSSIAPPQIPSVPPPPPMPVPARAGYKAFASDPINQSAISKHITPPNTSILPPTIAAPQPWTPPPSTPSSTILPPGMTPPSQMASVNPPKAQMASANPPQMASAAPPSLYGGQVGTISSPQSTAMLPSVSGKTPAPLTVNPYGTPTQAEYFAANPNQQAKTTVIGKGWGQTLANMGEAAVLGAAGGLKGDPSAGANWVFRQAQNDTQVPEVNNQRYRSAVVEPQIDALKAQEEAATIAHTQAQTGDIGAKHQQQLAQHGLKEVVDANGNTTVVSDPDSPITKANANKDAKVQAATEYLGAQTASAQAQKELRDAQAAYTNNKSDPNSLISKQIAARLRTAEENAQTSRGRLNQAQLTYRARYLGTGADGQALPGAMLTDDGTPVGSTFSANVRPTGTERNKGDMANSADTQLADIKSIMQRHPDMFGPGYGQTSAFKQWIGSQDPDAQKFVAARTIAADHLAGTFGGRSEYALQALDNAIGQFKDNPAAAIAGVDQLSGANKSFMKAGTVKTAGSNAGKQNNMVPPGGNKPAMMFARDPQGKLHQAPAGTPLPPGWKAGK